MNTLAWGARVAPLFVTEIKSIAIEFGWSYSQASYLMACIAFETAETFSPSIVNPVNKKATGLIQFMPKTAIDLGTTVQQLAKMDVVEQLQYVKQYFHPYRNRVKTLEDMYMAILMPKYVGQPNNSILFKLGTTAYAQNKGLDVDKNGEITKAEASSLVLAKFEKGMRPGYRLDC